MENTFTDKWEYTVHVWFLLLCYTHIWLCTLELDSPNMWWGQLVCTSESSTGFAAFSFSPSVACMWQKIRSEYTWSTHQGTHTLTAIQDTKSEWEVCFMILDSGINEQLCMDYRKVSFSLNHNGQNRANTNCTGGEGVRNVSISSGPFYHFNFMIIIQILWNWYYLQTSY